jgi:phthiocerol/phenolphthiocerol synthesis type-I polyketide synthase E
LRAPHDDLGPAAPVDLEAPERLAIVGMACRLPGAGSPAELWRHVRDGVESISRFDEETLAASGVAAELRRDPAYVPARGVIEDVELFDAELFGLTPREAELMDPQHRLFLECSWQACEHAGYDPQTFAGRIGVYGGSGFSSYLVSNLLANRDWLAAVGGLQARLFNDKDFLTTQVSYRLNLRGPSLAVQTACSTSLVALHLACQALLEGECEMALAGGATAAFPHRVGYLYQEGGIGSPDGHCRAFDVRAAGAVEGNGAGVVLVRRLDDALAAGDTIHAVVLATAVNNDGAGKAGYTAPSVDSQTRVVLEALRLAGVEAGSIGYVEAHGSGTPLGDPIEVEALSRAFRASTTRRGYCALGSVKPNLGHADTAAGVASLIKTVEALRHRQLPPLLHFTAPNPALDLAQSPFFIPREACDWPAGEAPRRAGVNSLGIGGTNAHVVLEEAPPAPAPGPSRRWQLLLLSARTAAALDQARSNLAAFLAGAADPAPREATAAAGAPDGWPAAAGAPEGLLAAAGAPEGLPVAAGAPEGLLADVAHTLRVGRKAFRHRQALLCGDVEEARRLLASGDRTRLLAADLGLVGGAQAAGEARRPIAFLLPGLGDQAAGSSAELYDREPAFRAAIDRCAELALPHLGVDLRQVLYPEAAAPAGAGRGGADAAGVRAGTESAGPGWPPRQSGDLRRLLAEEPAGGELERTALAHPAVFAVEYALAQLWAEWGIVPAAMLGYSLGELAAACLAGVLSLPDAIAMVAARARLVEALPAGSLLAVPLPAPELAALLGGSPEVALAAANGPALSVAGGSPEAVAALARRLAERGIACRRVAAGHAFHTEAMRPAADGLARLLAGVPLAPPRVPFVSNLTGTWITDREATDPAYWAEHLCRPVRFAEGLATLLGGESALLLEVGPGQALATLARQHPARQAGQLAVSSLPDRRAGVSEQAHLLDALGRLWLAGAAPDWTGFVRHERRRRVPLPTYPFERRRYFVVPSPAGDGRRSEAPAGGAQRPPAPDAIGAGLALAPRAPLEDWLYVPTWERAPRAAASRPVPVPRAAAEAAGGRRRHWLLLLDDLGVGELLAAELEASGEVVSTARAMPGQGFADLGAGAYALDPGRPEGYRELLARLRDAPPDCIVHLLSLGAPAGGTGAPVGVFAGGAAAPAVQERGFYSLLALAQALGALPLSGPERRLHLAVVTDGLFEVAGGEPLQPEKATLLGPCRVLPQELPGVSCSVVEVTLGSVASGPGAVTTGPGTVTTGPGTVTTGPGTVTTGPGTVTSNPDTVTPSPRTAASGPGTVAASAADTAGALAASLAAELLAPLTPLALLAPLAGGSEPLVALRGSRRWVRRFRPLAGPAAALPQGGAGAGLRPRGVAVIAGGLGETGLVVAEHLFATAAARLALLVPPDTPPRAAWAEWLGSLDESDPAARRVRRVLALEAAGCELLVLPVDLVQPRRVAAAIERVQARFGAVNAVVHAAFTAGAGLLQWKTREQAAAVLAPAVDGTLALAAATRGMALDSFVLFGSNTAATGGFGQSDTAAAAAFLDAFAQAREAAGASFTQAIDWGLFSWQPLTMDDPAIAEQLRAGLAAYGIGAGDCARVLERALAGRLPQVTVSTQDLTALTARLAGFGAFPTLELLAGSQGSAGAAGSPAGQRGPLSAAASHPRPELPAAFEPPVGAAEEAIAAVWREAFGLDRVGRHDNFFDLGGNSLLAIQIVTRLAAASGLELSMASLLAAPTVVELALLPAPAASPLQAAGPSAPAGEGGGDADADADLERLLAEVEALGEEGAAARLAAENVLPGGRP